MKQKCPKCFEGTLEYDEKSGKVTCSKCGYADYIAKVLR